MNLPIPENEYELKAIHASGPGGQNVNKVATGIQLRFPIQQSSLPDDIKARLLGFKDKRITSTGVVVITANRYRTQESNRKDAIARLEALVLKASHEPRPRKATRPSRAAVEKRLQDKAHRGRLKQQRNAVKSQDQ